jgi:hypothetical protein
MESRGIRAALWLAVALGAFLRIPQIGRESFWDNEIIDARAASMGSLSGVIRHVQFPHSAAYPLLLHFWMKLDDSDAFVRLLSAAAGIGSILLVYQLTARLAGPGTAVGAALLLAMASTHIRCSREAAPYAVQIALMLAAAMAWLSAMRTNRWRYWLAFALLAVASCALHPLAIATLLGWYGLTFAAWRWGFQVQSGESSVLPRSFSLGRALFSFLLFAAAPLYQAIRILGKVASLSSPASEPLSLTAYGQELLRLLGGNWVFWTPALLLPVVVLGAFIVARASLFLAAAVLVWAAGTIAVWMGFRFFEAQFFDYHHLASHLPAFVILAAFGVEAVTQRISTLLKSAPRGEGGVRAGALVLLCAALWPSAWAEQNRHWTDYRGVGMFLSNRLDSADRFFIRPESSLGAMIDYYCPGLAEQEADVSLFLDSAKQADLEKDRGELYLASRTPVSVTSELQTRAFSSDARPEWGSEYRPEIQSLFVSWMEPQGYQREDFKRLYEEIQRPGSGPRSPLDWMVEANALAKAKAWDQACAKIILAASEAPNLYVVLRARADILLGAGRYGEAMGAFDTAFGKAPANDRWWMLASKAKALIALKRREEAARMLHQALEEPAPNEAYLYRSLGENFLALDQIDSAGEAFLESLKQDDKSAHARIRLGDVEFARGNREKALQYYESAAEIDGPDKAWALSSLDQCKQVMRQE